VDIKLWGRPGALTEQKTMPIFVISFTASHQDESLNSITALFRKLVFSKNALIASRFSCLYL
jgi:hypothetical protein